MATKTTKKSTTTTKKAATKPKAEASKPVEAESSPTCPECGASMVRRSGPYGDFFGCTNFKSGTCKATIKIEQ